MSGIRSQATPARDELAGVIHAEICEESLEDCLDPDWRGKCARAADVLLPAGWSKPRTVNSATELDALPMFTVIRSEQGSVWERQYGALGKPLWIEATQTRGFPHTSDEITLPTTVLFTPRDA